MNESGKKVSMLSHHVVIPHGPGTCLVERLGAHVVGLKNNLGSEVVIWIDERP